MARADTRPGLHFTADSGWINDPLGLTWHGDAYHLFFQHVPGQGTWDPRCHWGHAVSPDLLDWTQVGDALVPGPGEGCWSGSVAVPAGGPARIFYTRIDPDDFAVGTVRFADARDDDWRSWGREPGVVELPPGEEVVAFRDPFVFAEHEGWRMLVGGGRTDGTAVVYGYRSEDLREWRYTGVVASRPSAEREPVWTGGVWECPQLIEVDGSWVLTFSVWERDRTYYQAYALGDYRDGRFTAETWGRLTYGPCYYAGSTFRDKDGRTAIIYWLRGVDDLRGGWAGALSLPQYLHTSNGELDVAPPSGILLGNRPRVSAKGQGVVSLAVPAELEWIALGGAAHVEIGSLTAHLREDQLTVESNGDSWTCPVATDRVRVILDHHVAEFFPGPAVLAAPLDGDTRVLRFRASELAVRELWIDPPQPD